MPLIASDHLGAGVLIGPHHLAPVLRVELAGEHRRVHQVTKQHGELAAFSVGWTRFGCWGGHPRGWSCKGFLLLRRWGGD
jgi:hypothetical protein